MEHLNHPDYMAITGHLKQSVLDSFAHVLGVCMAATFDVADDVEPVVAVLFLRQRLACLRDPVNLNEFLPGKITPGGRVFPFAPLGHALVTHGVSVRVHVVSDYFDGPSFHQCFTIHLVPALAWLPDPWTPLLSALQTGLRSPALGYVQPPNANTPAHSLWHQDRPAPK
jgi:hypothetical protein